MNTKEVAIDLLQNSWNMKDVELQISENCEMFLNKLILVIHERVPFQFLYLRTLAFTPPTERKVPSMDEMDYMCMSGNGGNCTVINLFTTRLLKALGYSAYLCRGLVNQQMIFNPHLVIIVKDLVNTGDLHLVDCGFGVPAFRAIPLNFDQESPVYQDSFLEYKFMKFGNKILRMHGKGDLVKHNNPPHKEFDFIIGKWRRFLEFTIETLDCNSPELGNLIKIRYIPKYDPRAVIYPGGKSVLLMFGNILLIEQEDKTLKRTVLKTKKEIFQVFKDYFPSIEEKIVQQAYSTWKSSKL